LAQRDALNFLLATVAMPDVSGFEPAVDAAGQSYLKKSLFSGAPVETDVSNARYFTTAWFESTYDDDCGMYFYECLNHFGFYLDKVMAMYALSDPVTNFVARDTAEDVREFAISFYDGYPGIIEGFFGDLLAQDYAAFAPRWTGDDVAHPDYLTGQMPAGQAIDPAAGFTVQLYAAALGMARFQNNYDKHFLLSSRLWVKGSAFALAGPVVEYTDPATGTVYQAVAFADGSGIAQRMLARANAVRANPAPEASAELVRYGQLLDILVDLTAHYESWSSGYQPGDGVH